MQFGGVITLYAGVHRHTHLIVSRLRMSIRLSVRSRSVIDRNCQVKDSSVYVSLRFRCPVLNEAAKDVGSCLRSRSGSIAKTQFRRFAHSLDAVVSLIARPFDGWIDPRARRACFLSSNRSGWVIDSYALRRRRRLPSGLHLGEQTHESTDAELLQNSTPARELFGLEVFPISKRAEIAVI